MLSKELHNRTPTVLIGRQEMLLRRRAIANNKKSRTEQ
jgi:hypothetical protein